MKNLLHKYLLPATLLAACSAAPASAANIYNVYITEWMYNGDEFIEFTNLGPTAVDFTGWSFDDDSRAAGTVSLSAFGIVESGKSVILSEADAATFIASWGLTGVSVIGGNGANLGRNDEINLYDASNTLVDRLTFGDQNIPGTIRTQDISGNATSFAALGSNDVSQWALSVAGDAYGSYTSTFGYVANPGSTNFAPVPVPAAAWLLFSGLAGLAGIGRRQQGRA